MCVCVCVCVEPVLKPELFRTDSPPPSRLFMSSSSSRVNAQWVFPLGEEVTADEERRLAPSDAVPLDGRQYQVRCARGVFTWCVDVVCMCLRACVCVRGF